MGDRAARVGVHPRERARRPARQVRPRARGGAVPVARRDPDPRPPRRPDRRDHPRHRGAARVHRRRGRAARLERLARGRRDRERAPLRRDAPAGRRARASHRACRGGRRRRDDRGARARGRPAQPRAARSRRRFASTCSTPTRSGCVSAGPTRRTTRRRRRSGSASSGRSSAGAGERRASPSRSSPAASCSARSSPRGTRELDLARAVANQAAVALKKIQVLERLAEKNLIKDFFEDLAARRLGAALEGRSARLGCDLDQPHVVLAAEPVDDALERALLGLARGSLLDRREQALRALVPVPDAGADRLLEDLRAVHAAAGGAAAIGVSTVCVGEAAVADAFEEARHALLGATVLAPRADRDELRRARAVPLPPSHRARPGGARRHDRRGLEARRLRPQPRRVAAADARRVPRPRAAASPPPPRRSTSTRTRCASGSGGSARSPASTCARTTG